MAKRKKRAGRNSASKITEKSPFWAMAGGIIMILLAIFTLLGGFGAGGPLPIGLFSVARWAFGWGAYMVPVALIFFGVYKFTSEDNRIPLGKNISMLAFLILFSSWLHVAFISGDRLTGYTGGFGGNVGAFIGNLTLSALTKIPASIMLFIFAMLAFFFAFNISPDILLALGELFKRKEEDTDLAKLKKQSHFEIKGDGIDDVVIEEPYQKNSLSTFKNTAKKLTAEENHEALTAKSDPTWKFPDISLLNQKYNKPDAGDVEGKAEIIRETFNNFNISVDMESANIGPRVTQFTLRPPTGVKLTKITALENNLMLDLGATNIRMEAPIPGKRSVGIEVPNKTPSTVRISSVLNSKQWKDNTSPLGFVLGKDISGKPITASLDKMPHLLVAGQTGSGKSVMINTILTSLLYRNSPSDLKLILVDPKQVELKPYEDIPHLLTNVITEPEKCVSALKWTVAEMERRYKALSEIRVRSIVEYNLKKKEEGMPYIVVVIDELADLMMVAAKDVEALIVRTAQKARAVGIHLILATQRPSVNIITGLIKANVPGRIAFTTQSQIDSRTIIDQQGAEKLLGQGDMLLLTSDMPKPKRIQGALITDEETNKVTDFIRAQRGAQYDDEVVSQPVHLSGSGSVITDMDPTDEPIYKDAVAVVVEGGKASTSYLQTRLRIGYSKAARLMESMEQQGIIGPSKGSKSRDVLISSMDEAFTDSSAPAEFVEED